MSHDQNFKNLILDYPLDALRLFAPAEAARLDTQVKISSVRQEQLKSRLGDHFRELDCPLRVDWPDGRCETLLFALEEETATRHFSIHRLVHYCVDLASLCKTDRVIPVVIFLRPGQCAQRLQLGSEQRTYLDFHYVACHLARLPFETYRESDNIVARLNLPNMRHTATQRVEVYGQAMRGLLTLEDNPHKQEKYSDFIEKYGALNLEEQAQYQQDYPEEEHTMLAFAERHREAGKLEGLKVAEQCRAEGIQQGMQQGVIQTLLSQLTLKFGHSLDDNLKQRIAKADVATLQSWSMRILTANSVQEVLN